MPVSAHSWGWLSDDKEKAIKEYWDADFGVLESIDAQAIKAEDEDGNSYDYQ